MMDEQEDRLDALLRDAAKDYNTPPPTPKAEIWERVSAARASGNREVGNSGEGARAIRPLRPTRRSTWPMLVGIAALLALGVAVGRITAPAHPGALPGTAPATLSAAPSALTPPATRAERGELAEQLATEQHLGRVESFLTEFNTQKAAQDFAPQAQELLSTTRLLLDSKRLTDNRTRKLLEDLELVLVQIATLDPKDRREDLNFIADGLAQSHLRTRLRNAVPAGPTIRM